MEIQEIKKLSYPEKIEAIINNYAELGLNDNAAYIAQYVADYRPVNPPVYCRENITSDDIAERLLNTCNVTIDEVSQVMTILGYRLFISCDSPMWSLKHCNKSEVKNSRVIEPFGDNFLPPCD